MTSGSICFVSFPTSFILILYYSNTMQYSNTTFKSLISHSSPNTLFNVILLLLCSQENSVDNKLFGNKWSPTARTAFFWLQCKLAPEYYLFCIIIHSLPVFRNPCILRIPSLLFGERIIFIFINLRLILLQSLLCC